MPVKKQAAATNDTENTENTEDTEDTKDTKDKTGVGSQHPVLEYLDRLVWDGTPRLDRWLIDCAGAEDTAYVRAVGRLMLVAAVRRARQPGCRFDQLPIIEGPQGTCKSAALRVLAVNDEWFTDDFPIDANTRRLIESTVGKWIVEAGELKGMNRSDINAFKACLARQRDEARLAYHKKRTLVPRSFVIIGTTSDLDFLPDPIGNRRFAPVRVKRFDLERLRSIRDQLWAEAAAAEAAGEQIHLGVALPDV